MKKIKSKCFRGFLVLNMNLLVILALSQSTSQNYIATWTATAPVTDPTVLSGKPLSDVKLTVQYFDGLGRPIQTVAKQGSLRTSNGAKADLVTFQLYDGFGRDSATFLPYAASTTDGSYKADAFLAQPAFYNSTNLTNAPDSGQAETGANAHTLTVYEASPLNRVLESFAPGNSWLGTSGQPTEAARHSIKQKYWINTVKDSVRIWNCNYPTLGSWGTYSSPTSPFYAAGTLYKNMTVDEAGRQVIEYMDKDDQVILKKVQLTATADAGTGNTTAYAGWLCTYYIYDDLGNRRCVVQPEGVKWLVANSWNLTNTTILAEQCFRYEYDGRNRMVMKQVPGAGAVYMVYDNRDRLVMTQDADLRAGHKWIVTKYDNLNRADTTWLDSLPSTTFTTLLTAAAATSPYPTTAPTSANLLTATHYDDYTGITFPAGVSGTFKNTWSSYYLAASTTSFPYPVTPAPITATSTPVNTKSLVTWTQARVLNSNPVVFITTVNIYDDKGRIIQTQSNNITTNGVNVNTTQYSWSGQPLITINWQSKLGTRPDTSITVTKMTYDSLNRVVKTEMKQSNSKVKAGAMPANYITLSQIQYDAIGQVKAKYLGDRKTNDSTYNTTPLEKQYYEYNVRGWLLGINRAYARDAASTDSTTTTTTTQTMGGEMFTEGMTTLATVTYPNTNYFGFDLGYDKTNNNLIRGKTYTAAQYTGNIAGIVWKGANDKKVRIYNFTYDAVNRLTAANFGQYASGGFSSTNVNYTVNNLTYDNNGNIKTMNQYGLKTGSTSGTIDQLTYNYTNATNKLLNVIDAANDAASTLGDFHYPAATKTAATVDYTYDANGNMVTDANKKISSIVYNYLNLPQVITVTGKGTITYTYDAAGNKLKKVTVDNSITPALTTTTLYLGNSVYQNDTLQFFGTSEGRIRPNAAGNAFVYDYFLKDHLGNTRMVITDDYNAASPILEATSYYPYGLTMQGISLEASGSLVNKRRFFNKEIQEKEFTDGSGLDWYDYGMREYDQQIGRFFRIDPLVDKFQYLSPYQFSSDDPINNVDLDGAEGLPVSLYTKLVQNTVQSPNGTSAKVLGAITGIGGAVYGAINGLAHPGQALKGLGHMLSQSPVQNAVDYGMNVYSQYGNSGSNSFTNYAMGAHMFTDVAIALSPLKGESAVAKTGEAMEGGLLSQGKWITTNESMSESAASYQSFVTGQDASKSFLLNGVKFDGVAGNTLMDAKSGLSNFVKKSTGEFANWFKGKQGLLDQAERQLGAAKGANIQWYFENKAVMEATQKLFKKNGVEGIDLIYKPR